MKQLLFLCSLLLLLAAFVQYAGTIEYHGTRRFYTAVKDNKTYIALPLLQDQLDIIFPNDITFDRLASGIELYYPSSNGQCEDTTTLQFVLEINVGKYIRGEIKVLVDKMMVYLFEKCGGAETPYTFEPISGISASLKGGQCLKTGASFQHYNGENSVMKLRVSGAFGCQAFMILPDYMHIKDSPLNEAAARLPLNETFTGHDDDYWWLNANNESMPSNVGFTASGDVEINVLTSNKAAPVYLRTGLGQPVPSFVFEFDRGCQGASFELYLNLHADADCRIGIDLVQGGFKVAMGASGGGEFVLDSYYSPTLLFASGRVYVKVDTPLTFKSYSTCDYSNTTDVARDQLVVQIASSSDIAASCKFANLTLLGGDVARGIEVLRNRSSGLDGENATTTTTSGAANYTVNTTVAVQMTTNTSQAAAATEDARFPWWWIIVGVVLLGLLIAAVVLVYIFVIRPRRNKKQARRIRDVSRSAASEDAPAPRAAQMEAKEVGPRKKQSKIEVAAPPPPPQQNKEENWAYDPNSRDHPIVQLAKAGKL